MKKKETESRLISILEIFKESERLKMKKVVSLMVLAGSLFLLGMSVGCSLCCAPYDYCGPVYANGQCSNLARFRCGTAFGQGGCGMSGQVMVDENGQPIPVVSGQEQGIQQGVPQGIQPTPAPASAPRIQVSPGASGVAVPQQTQYRPASMNSQVPQRIAYAQPSETETVQQALPPVSRENVPAVMPQNGAIAVGADGYQKVEVYDENNQLMGYEIIDATGKSVRQLPAPSHVR